MKQPIIYFSLSLGFVAVVLSYPRIKTPAENVGWFICYLFGAAMIAIIMNISHLHTPAIATASHLLSLVANKYSLCQQHSIL